MAIVVFEYIDDKLLNLKKIQIMTRYRLCLLFNIDIKL